MINFNYTLIFLLVPPFKETVGYEAHDIIQDKAIEILKILNKSTEHFELMGYRNQSKNMEKFKLNDNWATIYLKELNYN